MSKAILSIALVVVAIAAPYLAPIALGLAAGSLAALAVVAAIEVGVALAGSLLQGGPPKGSLTNTATSRLYATLVTTDPRKWWLGGPTAGGNDVRYQTYTGSKQEYYHQLIAHASHQVQSIDEIWIDNEKAWTKIGGVQGRYVGWLTVTTRELATSANGIAIDSVWTAACTLTGCAYSYLQYKLLDPSNSNNASPFQSGISGRLTFRGKGAPTYDPRLDSTVVGGSGTQRAGTQSTWAWSDTGSRNPALQLLWYLLGWQINGKIALGMGLPPARIDLASFITAANHCDETVTLAAGGSEPRYRGDGLISEGDDRSAVVQHLCQTMNATLRDSGGKIALQVISNDLATPVATFGLNDILGSEQYEQTQPLNNYFNIVRGRRVDPTDQALYQLTDFPQAVLTSPDTIDRIQTMDYPLVQSNGQAQRLAKLSLKRAQYQAKYTATFGSNTWAVSLGNVVQLNHSGMNWTNKLMRVVAQSIAQSGQVKMTLLEESTDVYTWAAEDVAGTVGGTPTVVVPTSLPLGSISPGATKNTTTYSSTAPTSPTDGDLWVDTTSMPYLYKMRVAGAWQVTSNYVTGTQHITDGAGLGNTAIWSGVTGAGKAADYATVNNVTYSTTAPASPANGDIWVDTSVTPNVTRYRISGSWQIGANYVTNTNQVTDGANLGGTAAWTGVTSRPANVAALAGTEVINNANVTLTSAGVFANGAGGTATVNALSLLNGPTDAGADVTLLVGGSKSVNIACDYTGAVKSGQLPLDALFTLKNGANTDVTTSASWAATQSGGSATFTPTTGTPNATGDLNVTALATSTVTLTMTATYSGKTRTGTLTLNKVLDPPPTATAGNPGTTASTSTIAGSTATTAYPATANISTLSVVAGTAGQVACTFPDAFRKSTIGTEDCYGKWQWRVVGGTFADVATEILSDVSADRGNTYNYSGSLSLNMTKTGLTSGTTYEFRLFLRSAGGAALTHSGTASAVGS